MATDAPGPTSTAVIVAVPSADPVVATHRRRFDVAASWGVPAHVSIVYPFAGPADIDEAVLARLADAVASVASFDCVFARPAWFAQDVLWLAPEPDLGFRALTSAIVAEFPQYVPYGGQFDDVVPHLTVGANSRASLAELRAVEQAVVLQLPIRAEVDRVSLIAGTDAPDSWRTIRSLPLGRR